MGDEMKTITDEEYLTLVLMADFQYPKKPNLVSDGYADGYPMWDAFCPKCGCGLEDSDAFCPDCGQMIDWSEDDTVEEEYNKRKEETK